MTKPQTSVTTQLLIEMIKTSDQKTLRETLPNRIEGLKFSGVIEQTVWKGTHMRIVVVLDDGAFRAIADFDSSIQKTDKPSLRKGKSIEFMGTVISFGSDTLVVESCRRIWTD
jgi:hypothetical protein